MHAPLPISSLIAIAEKPLDENNSGPTHGPFLHEEKGAQQQTSGQSEIPSGPVSEHVQTISIYQSSSNDWAQKGRYGTRCPHDSSP